VRLWFVFNYKILALFASKLGGARLFGIEMVEARLPRKYLAILGKL
jgi:hypothetical protein